MLRIACLMFFGGAGIIGSCPAETARSEDAGIIGRARECADRFASVRVVKPLDPKDAMPVYTARILKGVEVEATLNAVDRMMDAAMKAKPDPFHLHAIIHAERVGGSRWPDTLRRKFRAYCARWDFSKPIGVSLNYELMRDGAGWIAAGVWPDLEDKAGNQAARIRELCGGRLLRTLDSIPKQGSTEYDAPLYYGTDFMALRLLADFADDNGMRCAAREALQWMLYQTAAHWHRGYAITTSGRSKYWGSQMVSPDEPGATTGMAWILFGGDRPADPLVVPQCFWLACPGPLLDSFEPILRWQEELRVPRTVRAYVNIPSHGLSVRKTAWITEGYGLASQRADGTGPGSYLYKETRGSLLRWVSDKPASTFLVFQENRRRPHEKIANAFAYGENPYLCLMQHNGTLIGIHDVPEDYGFWKSTAAFTTRGAILRRTERDGWIFAHGGTVLFAFRFFTPGAWRPRNQREGYDPLVCDAPCNAWVLETSPVEAFGGGGTEEVLGRFADAVVSRTRFTADLSADPPRTGFTNLDGRVLDLQWSAPGAAYQGSCKVDGRTVDDFPPHLLELDGKVVFP